jgi:hypothetical protein
MSHEYGDPPDNHKNHSQEDQEDVQSREDICCHFLTSFLRPSDEGIVVDLVSLITIFNHRFRKRIFPHQLDPILVHRLQHPFAVSIDEQNGCQIHSHGSMERMFPRMSPESLQILNPRTDHLSIEFERGSVPRRLNRDSQHMVLPRYAAAVATAPVTIVSDTSL